MAARRALAPRAAFHAASSKNLPVQIHPRPYRKTLDLRGPVGRPASLLITRKRVAQGRAEWAHLIGWMLDLMNITNQDRY